MWEMLPLSGKFCFYDGRCKESFCLGSLNCQVFLNVVKLGAAVFAKEKGCVDVQAGGTLLASRNREERRLKCLPRK